jgi:hypothetical protein
MLQSYKKLDDFIIDFSGKIFFLKKYETDQKEKYSKHHRDLFNELLNSLVKRNKFGLDQNLWTELYYHSIYFYKNIKKIGKIPAIGILDSLINSCALNISFASFFESTSTNIGINPN